MLGLVVSVLRRCSRARAGRWHHRHRAAAGVLRRAAALVVVPLVVTGLAVVPVAIQVAHPAKAKASTKSVLILGTSVNGGTSSAEAGDVPAGVSVTADDDTRPP